MVDEPVKVEVDGKTIILVGTAHVSKKSVEDVSRAISSEKPDVVCVELCKDRKHALLEEKKWDTTDVEKVIKEGKIYLFLIQILLANFQRRVGEELRVKPGSEMLEAMKKAEEAGIPVELVDRDVRITLKRAIAKTKFTEKLNILGDLLTGFVSGEEIDEKLVEELKGEDMISRLLKELSEDAPSVKEVLVDERNRYIAYRIMTLHEKKIVAVVGAGHLKGIKEILEGRKEKKKIAEELSGLESVEGEKSKLRYVAYAIPLVFAGVVVWGLISHGEEVMLRMFWKWTIIHCVLGAAGAILAFAHPLTILTAFIVSPFTALDPTTAAGWFAGYVELKARKPRVLDFKGLFKLRGIGDYWKNRVTRVLLVVILVNLGSSLATFIAIPYMASLI